MVSEEIIGFMYAVVALFSSSLSPLLYKVGMRNDLHVLEANTIRSWGVLIPLTPILIMYKLMPYIPWELMVFVVFSISRSYGWQYFLSLLDQESKRFNSHTFS